MTTLKSIGYTVLILACITLAFVVIPVIGFLVTLLLVTAAAVFFAYFIYTGVASLQEMEAELKKAAGKKAKQ